MKKPKVALVRGKFLNKCEMQSYEPLVKKFDITAFGSHTSFHTNFNFPTKKPLSTMDIPDFPYKMPILNRLFVDAHYLLGLEKDLQGYDIAHSAETYYHYTHQCLEAKKKGHVKKVVVTVYENIPHANEGIWGRKRFKTQTRQEVDVFLAVTNSAKNTLIEEGVEEKKIKVVYPGVNTHRFSPKKRKDNTLNILFVGRLEKYKGIYNILDAFKDLHTKFDNAHLTFVGGGAEEQDLKDKVYSHGLREFVTFKKVDYSQIHKEYQQADILVTPSIDTPTWHEQFGYVLVEAMSCGLPVITTDAGAIPEVVGDTATVVPQDNTTTLTKELIKLIGSPKKRATLGKKARQRALNYFDSKKVAQNISKIYLNLL